MKQANIDSQTDYEPARAQSPLGPTVQDVLDADTRPVPSAMRETSAVFMGDADLPKQRYYSREFHDREMRHVWHRIWQVACRVEDILEIGDHILYDIGDEQIIVARGDDGQIRAFPNACLHRGTTLCKQDGNLPRFRCPFHGYTWSLAGELIAIPSSWDFPHVDKDTFRLPQIRVGEWGGFVFLCFSPETPPLDEYLEDLPEYFKEWPLENRHKSIHVAKIIRCNWKVAMEAFLEGYHIPTTHPEADINSGDSQAQYDVWPHRRHMNRVMAWNGAANARTGKAIDPNKMLDVMAETMPVLGKPGDLRAEEGQTARMVAAERFRQVLSKSTGVDLSSASDSEMLDSIQYFLFPNLIPWSGVGAPIVYRFRPNGHDPESCIMEIMYLFVRSPDAPKKRGTAIHWLADEEPFTNARELGGLALVFEQDRSNLERIQKGLRVTHKPGVTLANYQEIRIRHYHRVIDEYIAEGEAADQAQATA